MQQVSPCTSYCITTAHYTKLRPSSILTVSNTVTQSIEIYTSNNPSLYLIYYLFIEDGNVIIKAPLISNFYLLIMNKRNVFESCISEKVLHISLAYRRLFKFCCHANSLHTVCISPDMSSTVVLS